MVQCWDEALTQMAHCRLANSSPVLRPCTINSSTCVHGPSSVRTLRTYVSSWRLLNLITIITISILRNYLLILQTPQMDHTAQPPPTSTLATSQAGSPVRSPLPFSPIHNTDHPLADQSTAEIWAYDHNCVEIGHNPSIPVPITLKDALTTQKFPFDSQLPNVIVVQFTQNYAPASIAYAGQVYGWGATTSFCNNAGPSNLSPGFRLSCYVPFSC